MSIVTCSMCGKDYARGFTDDLDVMVAGRWEHKGQTCANCPPPGGWRRCQCGPADTAGQAQP